MFDAGLAKVISVTVVTKPAPPSVILRLGGAVLFECPNLPERVSKKGPSSGDEPGPLGSVVLGGNQHDEKPNTVSRISNLYPGLSASSLRTPLS
jgi:hypothetical protein